MCTQPGQPCFFATPEGRADEGESGERVRGIVREGEEASGREGERQRARVPRVRVWRARGTAGERDGWLEGRG